MGGSGGMNSHFCSVAVIAVTIKGTRLILQQIITAFSCGGKKGLH